MEILVEYIQTLMEDAVSYRMGYDGKVKRISHGSTVGIQFTLSEMVFDIWTNDIKAIGAFQHLFWSITPKTREVATELYNSGILRKLGFHKFAGPGASNMESIDLEAAAIAEIGSIADGVLKFLKRRKMRIVELPTNREEFFSGHSSFYIRKQRDGTIAFFDGNTRECFLVTTLALAGTGYDANSDTVTIVTNNSKYVAVPVA